MRADHTATLPALPPTIAFGGPPGHPEHRALSPEELGSRFGFSLVSCLSCDSPDLLRNLPLLLLPPEAVKQQQCILGWDREELMRLVRSGWNHPDLVVARDPYGGHGLWSGADMAANSYLGEYGDCRSILAGLTCDSIVGTLAFDRKTTDSCPTDNYSMRYPCTDSVHISALHIGSLIRFVNHAPEESANCRIEYLLLDGCYHALLFCLRDVSKGEHLCFDYGPGARIILNLPPLA